MDVRELTNSCSEGLRDKKRAFYATRRFITVFTTALHWSPSDEFSLYPHILSQDPL
jgi:hypothetical protein